MRAAAVSRAEQDARAVERQKVDSLVAEARKQQHKNTVDAISAKLQAQRAVRQFNLLQLSICAKYLIVSLFLYHFQ